MDETCLGEMLMQGNTKKEHSGGYMTVNLVYHDITFITKVRAGGINDGDR